MRNKYPCKSEFVWNVHIQVICWSWSVSQFSTCMTFLRHGCQRNSFWNSQTDSQMYPFHDQMNWQFVQVLMHSKIPLKTSCTGHWWRKAKDFFFVQGKSAWYCFKADVLFYFTSSVSGTQNKLPNSHHNHPRHPFITWIYRDTLSFFVCCVNFFFYLHFFSV